MSYELGIDLGTTYTAAAICRSGDTEIVTLGTHSAAVASVVYVGEDGTVLFGEAAERRAVTDPERVVREFKRRIGDETPLVVGGHPYNAHELAARMVRWVAERVAEQEGGPPRRIAVTRPASWGDHKKELFREALAAQGLRVVRLAEPQAAAVSYAASERVEPGSTIAIYDLGGGTFDATVARKTTGSGFELLGQPEGIEDLGGVDFDEEVFRHVTASLGKVVEELDPADPDVLSAVARLRRECVEAKEALSVDTEATIPVFLPGVQTQVRLTRAEFEEMIRPTLERTLEALTRTVASAGLTPRELSAVLLVGGSSRIPLVTRMVSAELGLPVAVDADPRTAIATGAALVLSDQSRQAQPDTGPIPAEPASGPSAYGPYAGGMAGGAAAGGMTDGGTIFGTPVPPQPSGEMPRQPSGRLPAASSGDQWSHEDRAGDYRTGDYRTGGFRTGQAPAARDVEPPPWRKQGGSGKPSAARIAVGGALGAAALVGALLILPSLASERGDGSAPTTVPPTTVPGVQNTDPGEGDTGEGDTGGNAGGGNTGGGGGNTGGGNPGNQGGGGGGQATTTAPAPTTTTPPETTAPTTTSTTTTTTTTLPATTTTTEPPADPEAEASPSAPEPGDGDGGDGGLTAGDPDPS